MMGLQSYLYTSFALVPYHTVHVFGPVATEFMYKYSIFSETIKFQHSPIRRAAMPLFGSAMGGAP
jgi:hypothetical protein